MKKLILGITSLIFIASSFSSCTIEKRVHQDGYHISWNYKHASPSEIKPTQIENAEAITAPIHKEEITPNVHSVETLSASNSEDIVLLSQQRTYSQSKKDTVIPDQPKNQEEYFINNYVSPEQPQDIRDQQLANWALGLGIASVSTPIWATILFLGIGAAAGFSWALLGISVLIGVAVFLALEITAIAFAIRFLRRRGKDPEYSRYRSRAITGLVLAGIYPALIAINIILALVLAI
jgi:hypothetical protein